MRTTLRIDDDLLEDLRREARQRGLSMAELANRLLRRALAGATWPARRRRHREKTYSMGRPRVDLTRAIAGAELLEDEAMGQKIAVRKRASWI